jgi:hypothetical protein
MGVIIALISDHGPFISHSPLNHHWQPLELTDHWFLFTSPIGDSGLVLVSQDLLGLYFDLQCGSMHVEEVLNYYIIASGGLTSCCAVVFFYRFCHHKLYKNGSDFRDVLGFRNL